MSFISKQLIPLSYINEACSVSENIDEKKMKPNLEEAQLDLLNILGAEFYEEIENQYSPSGGSFTTANEELYENYIKKYLAWQSYFYSLGFSQTESTPTGERSFKDENSDLASDIQLFSKEKNVKAKAFKFKSAMIEFLKLQQYRYSQGVSGAYAFAKWVENCKTEFQFGISAIGRQKDEIFSVNRAVTNNE